MEKKWISGIAGLLDPALVKFAQDLRDLVGKYQLGSLLRSNLGESLVGALRGIIEAHAEKYPALGAVGVEKLSDLSKFLSATLARAQKTDYQDLLQDFLAQTAARLRKAENPHEEFEKIKEELVLFKQIMQIARQKPESSSPVLENLNQKLEELRDRLKLKEA